MAMSRFLWYVWICIHSSIYTYIYIYKHHSKLFQIYCLLLFFCFTFIKMGYGQSDQNDTKYQQISLSVNTLELPSPTSSVVASKKVIMPPFVTAGLPIFTYCVASIVMTVTNKFVVSGDFNMVFFLLTIQSLVTVLFLQAFKFLNLIKYREFDAETAKKWYPIVIFLVAMIYTGSKALQYLPIPVYTIFKNLTIILIAYGEVLWFGGSVTSMMMMSFGLMTLSSVIAGWNDVSSAIQSIFDATAVITAVDGINMLGYFWMAINCLSSASFVLYMRKRIKLTNFKDFDTVYYNNLLSIPLLIIPSLLLEDWSYKNLLMNL